MQFITLAPRLHLVKACSTRLPSALRLHGAWSLIVGSVDMATVVNGSVPMGAAGFYYSLACDG